MSHAWTYFLRLVLRDDRCPRKRRRRVQGRLVKMSRRPK